MVIPANNPRAVKGIELGRNFFWKKKFSGNNSMSWGTYHMPANSFSDSNQWSIGVNGEFRTGQAMALLNLEWATSYFWNGRVLNLEDQLTQPVVNPIEMDESSENALNELRNDTLYVDYLMRHSGPPILNKMEQRKRFLISFAP